MISEEDKLRVEEARDCDTCPSWHHHCGAECCKIIFLKVSQNDLDRAKNLLSINTMNKLTFDEIRYYRMHDVEYVRGFLRFKKSRITFFCGKFVYIYPCIHVENNLCKLHGTDEKPTMCTSLTKESLINGEVNCGHNSNIGVTANCLFKYKLMEDQNV